MFKWEVKKDILVSIRKDRYINRFYWKVLIGTKECDINGHRGLRPALVQTTGKKLPLASALQDPAHA